MVLRPPGDLHLLEQYLEGTATSTLFLFGVLGFVTRAVCCTLRSAHCVLSGACIRWCARFTSPGQELEVVAFIKAETDDE